ncbi:MAG: hypothetical protein E6Q85_09130, partial [Thiothrix sp.]
MRRGKFMKAFNALSLSIALALANGTVGAESASTETKKAEPVSAVETTKTEAAKPAESTAALSPQDGLTADEYKQITTLLKASGGATDKSLYPLIELVEPDKAEVLKWKAEKTTVTRRAMAQFTTDKGVQEAIVDLTNKKVESTKTLDKETMVTFTEFISAMDVVLKHEDFVKALAKRNVKAEEAFCLPLTAGNFMLEEDKGKRLMKVPCYVKPTTSSNFYAKPIEGLYAVVDLRESKVIRIEDEVVLPVPQDDWGYTEEEIAKRAPLRPENNPAVLTQTGKPNYSINGSEISWDIWK